MLRVSQLRVWCVQVLQHRHLVLRHQTAGAKVRRRVRDPSRGLGLRDSAQGLVCNVATCPCTPQCNMPCPPLIQRAGANLNTYNKPCAHEPIVSRSPREVQLREHRPAHRCRRVPTDWRVHSGVPRVRLASTSAIALARAALRCAAHSFGCACRRRKHCARRGEPPRSPQVTGRGSGSQVRAPPPMVKG